MQVTSDIGSDGTSAPRAPDDTAAPPGLALFRGNGFRVLRLKPSASATEASAKADLLARRRGGPDDSESEPVAWLPPPDELELRAAARHLGEPERRLRDQLLWFDFERDPRGEALRRALVEADAKRLAGYLASDEQELSAGEPEAPALGRERALLAHRLNQANLRLLLAFSWLNGSGPRPLDGVAPAARDDRPISFIDRDGLEMARNVHARCPAPAPDERRLAAPAMLHEALMRWGALLANPWLRSSLETAIRAFADDRAGRADIEAVAKMITTTLAETVVAEMMPLMRAGAIDRVLELAGSASGTALDPAAWMLAFAPVHGLLRADLDELRVLVDPAKPPSLRGLELYLERVTALAASWTDIASDDAFGLDRLIDGAVEQVLDRVLAIENPSTVEERIEELLRATAKLARSAETAERAREIARGVGAYRRTLCSFCHKRSATPACSAVLHGRKEVHREQLVSAVRVTYATTSTLVLRCETCARLHGFFRHARYTCVAVVVALSVLGWWLFEPALALLLLCEGVVVAVAAAAYSRLVSRLTPRDEHRYSSYTQSEAHQRLRDEAYRVESFDYSENAGAKFLASRRGA